MKIRLAVLALTVAAGSLWLAGNGGSRASAATAGSAGSAGSAGKAAAPAACQFPTGWVGTPAETAWRLFVAANCPGSGTQLVWESWIEQDALYPASGNAALQGAKAKRLHGSPLFQALMARKKGMTAELSPATECNAMGAPPSNVIKGATVCEEVRLNPSARMFVSTKGYQVRSGQIKAAQAGTDIQFPIPAMELKVDWIPATDFATPFTCAKPPQGVHVEMIDGACYAMAGIHLISKIAPNWIWATFEPQSLETNPNRCITFGECNDPWGSVPPTSKGGAGGFTQLSPGLQALMKSANLAPALYNYRLDGVQTEFGTAANPTLLGNSIIEGENVGMTTGTASCITCHSVSTVKTDGTDGITVLGAMPTPPVGPEYVVPKGWIARDFVWSLALACPGGIQNCTSSAPAASATKSKKPKTKTP
jgi:hypothetical protein